MSAAILTTFLFAYTAICATQSAKHLGSNFANMIRLLIALCLLGSWHFLFGSPIEGKPFLYLIAAGAIGFGLGGLCMFQAFPRIGSTLSLLVVECAAAISAGILGWFVLGASLTGTQILFAVLSLSGVIIGLFPKSLSSITTKNLISGAIFATIASCGQSVSFIMTKQAFIELKSTGHIVNPMSAAAYRLAGGASIAILVYLTSILFSKILKKGNQDAPIDKPLIGTIWAFKNALFGPVLGVTCMLWAIHEVGNPGLVQTVVASATLISVPLSRLLEGKKPGITYYIGASISICGTAGLLLIRN